MQIVRMLTWHVQPLGIWPALIGAAGAIAGGILGGQSSKSQAKYVGQNEIGWRVAAAKQAGVHPLFALGQSGGYGGGSGSGLGSGIAQASRHIAQYGRDKSSAGVRAAQIGAMEASAARDNAQALATDSERKRNEQAVNAGPRMNPDGAITFPLGGGDRMPGLPPSEPDTRTVTRRPLSMKPHVNIPQRVTAEGTTGSRRRSAMNPDLNLDEVAQLEYVSKPWADYLGQLWDELTNNTTMSPKARASLRNRYYYWKHRLLGKRARR